MGACSRRARRTAAIALVIAATGASAGSTSGIEGAATATALAQLDGFALGLAKDGPFAGALLVSKDGTIVLERAYGSRDEMTDAPNTPATGFNLASAGKMFTTVAVLQQVAAGRITLDTPVGEVLTDYPNGRFASNVTVRHLLTHTAGAGDIDLFGVENLANRERARSVADMVALHSGRDPEFEPGSQQKYGNFGYVVLGRMVEVLSGESFEEYVTERILAPAGMTQTRFANCDHDDPGTALGYVTVEGARVRNCATLPRRGFPAGGQVSTVRDMHRFVRALLDGTLLPAEFLAEATRTQHEFMGLGFFATGYGPGVPERDFRWGHGGSADGICTDVRTYPRTGETIVVLANTDAPSCYSVANFLHEQWTLRNDPHTSDTPSPGAAQMQAVATGSFTVQIKPVVEPSVADGVSLGRMSIDKQFEGDLVGTGKGEMLTAMTPVKGSAGYVAIEKVTGVLHGRAGSFVFQHTGTMDHGAQSLSITVVPDSGTGALTGISGTFLLTIVDGRHLYEFSYALPD